jgi:hypothetical protein
MLVLRGPPRYDRAGERHRGLRLGPRIRWRARGQSRHSQCSCMTPQTTSSSALAASQGLTDNRHDGEHGPALHTP